MLNSTTQNAVSIVVPAYNSEQSLPILAEKLEQVLAPITSRFELILINDGSRDHTWDIIDQLCHKYIWVIGINLMRNYGQHNALLCGIRAARYPIIVTMDDDLQHPPAEIPKLLDKLAEGYDVVYGVPQHQQHGFLRDLASQVTKFVLQSAMSVQVARNVSAFRVFRTPVRNAFASYQNSSISIDVLLTWGTTRFGSVLVQHDIRRIGVSNYTLRKLVIHAFNMMTGFSVWPLQIASLTGFVFTLFGIGVLIFVVARYIIDGGSVQGFPFLASIIAIFAGVQLFALGIMGEYLARMYQRTMDKPPYVIAVIENGLPLDPSVTSNSENKS